MSCPEIIPSLFTSSQEEFLSQLSAIDGAVQTAQIDIARPPFVSTTTWADPATIAMIETNVRFELHLMTEHPIEEMKRWQEVSTVRRVIFHYESLDDIEVCIDVALQLGWEPCLALNPDTDVAVIAPYQDYLFGVMIMGVYPGAQGQSYLPNTTERLHTVHTNYPQLFLSLDGGVNMDTLPEIVPTQLDAICPGSALFAVGNPKDNIHLMKKQLLTLTTDK